MKLLFSLQSHNTFTFQYKNWPGVLNSTNVTVTQKQYRAQLSAWCKESFIYTWTLEPYHGPAGRPFFTIDKLVIDNDIDVTTFTLRWL